jgi:hypothetical protein
MDDSWHARRLHGSGGFDPAVLYLSLTCVLSIRLVRLLLVRLLLVLLLVAALHLGHQVRDVHIRPTDRRGGRGQRKEEKRGGGDAGGGTGRAVRARAVDSCRLAESELVAAGRQHWAEEADHCEEARDDWTLAADGLDVYRRDSCASDSGWWSCSRLVSCPSLASLLSGQSLTRESLESSSASNCQTPPAARPGEEARRRRPSQSLPLCPLSTLVPLVELFLSPV